MILLELLVADLPVAGPVPKIIWIPDYKLLIESPLYKSTSSAYQRRYHLEERARAPEPLTPSSQAAHTHTNTHAHAQDNFQRGVLMAFAIAAVRCWQPVAASAHDNSQKSYMSRDESTATVDFQFVYESTLAS